APGCVIYDQQASATFTWNRSACADLAIDSVSLDLYQPSTRLDVVAEAYCEDGEITVDGLDADTYSVTLDAFTVRGVPVVTVQDTVSVYPGDNVFSYRF